MTLSLPESPVRARAVIRGLAILEQNDSVEGSNETPAGVDMTLITVVADLLHFQQWRRSEGISLMTAEELIRTAQDIWATEDTFTDPVEHAGE